MQALKNFSQLQESWDNFGKTEPWWSVVTDQQFASSNVHFEAIEEFYSQGNDHVNFMEMILQDHGYTFQDKIILDFGCGLGRLTKACLSYTTKCYGMDISQPHLDIAKTQVPDAKFFLVDSFEKLPELPEKPEIIISLITLQHARPDLIEKYVHLLLKQLANGGIALLHIPYYIENYVPVTDLQHTMEMHFVPKERIHNIALSNNCVVLGDSPMDFCGGGIQNCTYVIKKLLP